MSAFDAFARFYDADYGTFSDDVPFYRAMARRTGGPILELMCGSGRLLEPLAREGHHVTGVDVSPQLLSIARHKLATAGLNNQVELVETDVRVALPSGPFAMVIVGLNSFMHLETVDDQLAVLHHIHQALEPDGVLVLDLYNPDPRELIRHNGEMLLDKTFMLMIERGCRNLWCKQRIWEHKSIRSRLYTMRLALMAACDEPHCRLSCAGFIVMNWSTCWRALASRSRRCTDRMTLKSSVARASLCLQSPSVTTINKRKLH